MPKKWETLSSKELADYYIFKAIEKVRKSPITNKEHSFYVLDSKDWVNIIPITKDNKVIMVKQYRQGIDDIILETPTGTVDEADSDYTQAIKRELLEETGYKADSVELIGEVHANPAFMNNKMKIFKATDVKKVTSQNLDETEDIEVVEVDLEKIPRLIKSGEITHSMTIAAFYFLN